MRGLSSWRWKTDENRGFRDVGSWGCGELEIYGGDAIGSAFF